MDLLKENVVVTSLSVKDGHFSLGGGNVIPIKMEDFFDAKISIYSRSEFFIYLFDDFIQRFSNETPCP